MHGNQTVHRMLLPTILIMPGSHLPYYGDREIAHLNVLITFFKEEERSWFLNAMRVPWSPGVHMRQRAAGRAEALGWTPTLLASSLCDLDQEAAKLCSLICSTENQVNPGRGLMPIL